MAKRSADEAITRGTANVFADLGYADAEERQTKLKLAHALNEIVAERGLTQAGAAKLLGVNQPKVSALMNYRLSGFSVERLMTLLTRSTATWRSSFESGRRRAVAGRFP
jgi:predicted XRE-type DNA-binding protein